MRIVNHKISIAQGETPLYTFSVKYSDGSPYVLTSSDVNTYAIEFVIRPTIYSKGLEYIFRRYIPVDIHRFDSTTIVTYAEADWNDLIGPSAGNENLLHKCLVGGVYEYAYFANGVWNDYDFIVSIQFPYAETKNFEPKPYLYEINLLGGTAIVPTPVVTSCPVTVSRKVVILSPKEFKVEGSLGV